MKKIFTLFVLLLPVMVFGQSRQSNKFFKQGTKLYKAEKYEEAIPYFQKSDSLDKAQLDPTAENYYRAELKMADCCHNLSCEKDDEGKYTEAARLHYRYFSLMEALFCEVNPIPVKTASSLMGLCTAEIRLPLVGLSAIHRELIQKRLTEVGLI